MSLSERFERLLPLVAKPGRYIGTEVNAVRKNRADVDLFFCLAFPDVYEVGMSHLGLQILYHVLNSRPRIACERVFAPWPDLEALLYRHDLPLLTLESRIPVCRTDILGFSLEYELSYATVLRMLAAARIPLLSRDRDASFPLVIAGGPCAYNPEPVADFFDAFVIGDGEEVVLEISDAFVAWRATHGTKRELLEALAAIPGVYVPSFFSIAYDENGRVAAFTPLVRGYDHVISRVVRNLNDAPYCTTPIVPYVQTVHDRAQIEIARGCSRGCRFCMAGMIYRPVREKSFARVMSLSDKILATTGYEELSPVSLSACDHGCIHELIRSMIADHRRNRIAVSLPSLRVATLTPAIVQDIKSVRKTGFTIAPEAGSERLRMVINKGFTEQEILETAAVVFDAGWKLLKLYFMIGLPTESTEDLDAIISLCRTIANRHRGRQLNVSVSTFVPKPHTPLQWEAQEHPDIIREKQFLLKRSLHHGPVHLKYHDRLVSVLEGVFSRGDRRLCDVLLAAHRKGAGFEAWTEHFNFAQWMEAFAECGIDPYDYLRCRDPEKPLPWAHITCGVDISFLKQEREKAFRSEQTPDCRTASCTGCGVCAAHAALPQLAAHNVAHTALRDPKPLSAADTPIVWLRLRYSKTGPARFLSHLELSRALARALRRARLPLRYSQGFHPLPRIVFYHALPVGVEVLGDICDVELLHVMSLDAIKASLQQHTPAGISLEPAALITGARPHAPEQTHTYRIQPEGTFGTRWPECSDVPGDCDRFHDMPECPITFFRKDTAYTVDLKTIISRLTLPDPLTIECELAVTERKTPKVAEIIDRIFKLENHAVRITKLPVRLFGPAEQELRETA